eukprot:comp24486_c0_seq1/m.46734 comp24486_c0_seq1/g.46734  ORF comp24486_c0_seq1/g.46734 comp24486_c0_seq1/m.46734 type:complete len:155 (-) comp24486_c0_seq1:484-948(-)
MNKEKLAKLQNDVRIGGKGTPRRKKKVVHKSAGTSDKQLQSAMKRLGINPIPGFDEANFFKEDGNVLHFKNPKEVRANLGSKCFSVTGKSEEKPLQDLLPDIIHQLGADNLASLRAMAEQYRAQAGAEGAAPGGDDDDIPELVENFDQAAKTDA